MVEEMTKKLMDDLPYLIESKRRQRLEKKTLEETIKIFFEFIFSNENQSNWVCNTPPGGGKTIALEACLKYLYHCRKKQSFLLVFPDNYTMEEFSKNLKKGHKGIPANFIKEVNMDNAESVELILEKKQFVLITKQRLLKFGIEGYLPDEYYYFQKQTKMIERKIIIDEIPEFFNSIVFEMGEKNNIIQWFDLLSEKGKTFFPHLRETRNLIIELVQKEITKYLSENPKSSLPTKKLCRFIDEKSTEKINEIIQELNSVPIDSPQEFQAKTKLLWFEKLFNEDSVGSVLFEKSRGKIICSELVDYSFIEKILVFDGTAHLTKPIYEKVDFELKKVKNRHDYKNRLFLFWHKISTSKAKRRANNCIIMNNISANFKKEFGLEQAILLPSKSDVDKYYKLGGISKEQYKEFFQNDPIQEQNPLNLLNTIGKNNLNEYQTIGLPNLPIMPPVEYQKIGLALFGLKTNLLKGSDLDPGFGSSRWFLDSGIQDIFERIVLENIYQIVHRTAIRNMTSRRKVKVIFYHNSHPWGEKISGLFNVDYASEKTISPQKVRKRAKKEAFEVKKHFDSNGINEAYPGQVRRALKDWLNNNFNNSYHREIIIEEFRKEGLFIIVNRKTNYKKIIKMGKSKKVS